MASGKQKRSKKAEATKTLEAPVVAADEENVQKSDVLKSVEQVLVYKDGVSLGELLYKTLMEGALVDHVVSDLLRIYTEGSAEAACCAVLNFVAKASGATQVELDGAVLKEDVDVTAVLEEMYARVPKNAAMYPLAQKDSKHRSFYAAYCSFFARLVESCYNTNIFFDVVFLPTLIRWLIAMSESRARCFRHTCIVALLSVIGSLNGLIQDLNNRLPSQGKGKKKQVSDLQENIQAIVELRNHVISQAIHQRPRDVAPEIRLLVFEHLENWILKYDDEFAENKYFRYFGMALYDKRPEIRAEALTMIQKALVTTPDSGNRMFLFLQYFAKRLTEMCGDVNMHCAELAVGVIVLILRVYGDEAEGKDILDNDMIDSALMRLFDERPTIRREAGVLLGVFIDSRIPAEISDKLARQKAAVELLCAFSATLRADYKETMPERYIIDALCPVLNFSSSSSLELPFILQGYSSLCDFITSQDAMEAVVGLNFAAAFLEKLRGRLDLGPIPKEDRFRGSIKKLSSNKKEAIDALVSSFSREVGMLLPGVLEKHPGDLSVLCGVSAVIASLDLNAFTSVEHVARINTLIVLMRKVTAAFPYCEEVSLIQITSAWLALLGDHPLRTEAKGQVQELLKQVFQFFATHEEVTETVSKANETTMLHVWCRMAVLSSLVSMEEQWSFLKTTFLQYTYANVSPVLLRLVLMTCSSCVMWQLDPEKPETETIGQMIGELLSCIFQLWKVDSVKEGDDLNRLIAESMFCLCDLCSLQYYTMSQIEQDVLIEKFGEISSMLGTAVREARKKLKDAEKSLCDGGSLADLAQCRREMSHFESLQMRLTTGVVRLLVLNRLSEDLAPRIFLQWLHAPTKSISDVFRLLFRTLRDRDNDSFALEKSILLSTYKHSSEELYQIGLKLSSMHWAVPDKYYAACVAIVRFGIDFALTTDVAMLQAVVAYCPRLLQPDAMKLAQLLASNDVLAGSSDPIVRQFIATIRRAARLVNVDGDGVSCPGGGVKRSLENGDEAAEECSEWQVGECGGDDMLVEGGEQRRKRRKTSTTLPSRRGTATLAPYNRVVTEDGWRVRPEAKNLLEAQSAVLSTSDAVEGTNTRQVRDLKGSPATSVTLLPLATQDTVLSSSVVELDHNEVFIATQEYD